MSEDNSRSYWGVLPGEIVHDRTLTIAAKYLYVILSSMAHKNGYCWPDNEALAEEMQLSKRRVVELLGMLRDCGYIRVRFETVGKRERRYIYCGMFPDRADDELLPPEGCEISHGGDEENFHPPCEKLPSPMRKIRNTNKDEKQIELIKRTLPPTPTGGGDIDIDKATAKPRRGSRTKTQPDYHPDWFERFWALYPRRTNRVAAVRAWDKLRPDFELCQVMAAAIKAQMGTVQWQDPSHIPHPSTWLNNARWTDEIAETQSGGYGGWAPDPEVY